MWAETTEATHTRDNGDMATDPNWPTAAAWLARGPHIDGAWVEPEVAVIGFGSQTRSISPTQAGTTPGAVRRALARYSTWSIDRDVDVWDVVATDAGDISNPDAVDGFERAVAILRSLQHFSQFTVVLGGDNSITYPTVVGLHTQHESSINEDLRSVGLITFDAHHDLRDGWSNGSPVRQLIEAGVPGAQVVQVGIAGFANSREYTARARDLGVAVITRDTAMRRPVEDIVAEALAIAGAGGGAVHVDVDVDVCDRSVVPGCPASSPGGFSAQLLRDLIFTTCLDPSVRSLDFTEVDAAADSADGRTVRLVALGVLESIAAYATRSRR